MGYIDIIYYSLKCPICGVKETQYIRESGSVYGSSGWGSGASYANFNVQWDNTAQVEPKIISAKCCTCHVDSQIKKSYINPVKTSK